jgi:hypothetical protein
MTILEHDGNEFDIEEMDSSNSLIGVSVRVDKDRYG